MIANKTRNNLNAENLFPHKIYWLNQISDELPETTLIADYVRPAIYEGTKKSVSFEILNDLSEKIIKFTNNSNFAIYLLLLAVLSIFFKKYNGTNDVIVGSPIYPKTRSDDNLQTKVIPLRFNVDNQLAFKDLLVQVKEIAVNGHTHQNYSFDELIELLNLPNTQNRFFIFDAIALLENIHRLEDVKELKNDLIFSFKVNGNLIACHIYYNDLLFTEKSIRIIADCYINILNCVINNSLTQISDIAVLSASDRNILLKDFNDNTKLYPINQTIDQLFEKQVQQTPDKFAAVFGNTQLKYRELNDKANKLAIFLSKLGVQKGNFVGIIKERDINFLIGILAIHKVGGVYVPIDSTYPPDRIKYMISNSEVRILLTDSSYLDILVASQEDCPVLECLICLDIKSEQQSFNTIKIYDELDFDNFPKENLKVNHQGIDPAYMIYTSGSTGLPKGVIIRHGSAINHIYAEFDALELTEDLTFLQTAPASSDISVWQFLAPILIGGKTVIIDTESICNPEKLFKVIKEEKITIVELVPVVLSGLLDYISQLPTDARLLPDLKWMMVTGESVSVELVNKWLRMYPSIKVVNAYGPSEAADDITQFIVTQPLPDNQRTVPIGKPLANLNIYILDAQMQLVPIGFPGEICVSGFGVAEGYWQNEKMTKSNFVPNPFSTNAKPLPGIDRDLIYKTGDLGRWLPDGNIEFLGRIDHQVKIRGFRIELGEIEALINQHSAVKETVVIVREENAHDKRLIAYVVLSPEFHQNEIATSELIQKLRNLLKERLPDYMVPSAILSLEALPLTPSGKIDRRALPIPNFQNEEISFVAPRTPAEELVADIWMQILKREHLGIHDNFFDLGGHSLLATQVISRLREAFRVELPLRSLFEAPTVAQLVERIEKMLTVQQLQFISMDAVDREEIEI
ncbi:non-ribosomal peptide synthetase [Anabaena subtropica]|uniref:Amino acid adenylation domain-containing protein n=1 Tax=Anabaena subtropica FACHB-260 TaxID=2692884 RepID=A0ABR8CRF0_9NOST|nr:non-ribosomal peptide synthetase [Anabaena subtropica]MBD2345772.1 amino acid adenylation domain-containing protein [Anabaena subtropica FACHB-260]